MNPDNAGDWSTIYATYSQAVYDHTFSRIGDKETATELTQEAFVLAYKQRHLLTDETVEGFLTRAADHWCDRTAGTAERQDA